MSTHLVHPLVIRRRLRAAAGFIMVASLLAACSASAASAVPSAPLSDRGSSSGIAIAPPALGLATTETPTGLASGSSGSAASGAAIAYPYQGSTGVAPDHTIVVTGSGTADVAADGSNRAAAERSALDAAIADARAQADVVAAAAHVTIDGALSVSASVSPYFIYPLEMMAPSAGGTTPGAMPPSVVNPPQGPTQLSASATVAFTIH